MENKIEKFQVKVKSPVGENRFYNDELTCITVNNEVYVFFTSVSHNYDLEFFEKFIKPQYQKDDLEIKGE